MKECERICIPPINWFEICPPKMERIKFSFEFCNSLGIFDSISFNKLFKNSQASA
jgi:hypothetical protein